MKNTTKSKNKIMALLLTAAITLGVSGCSEGTVIPTSDGEVLSAEAEKNKIEKKEQEPEGRLWYQTGAEDAFIFPPFEENVEEFRKLLTEGIPNEVLKKMSTAGLVETAFSYPSVSVPMSASSSHWVDGAKEAFKLNVFEELFNRKDAGSELVKIYDGITIDDIRMDEGYDVLKFRLFEYLLAEQAILDNLTDEERDVVKKSAVNLREERERINTYLGEEVFDMDATFFLEMHVLYNENEEFADFADNNTNMKHFLKSGWYILSPEEVETMCKYYDESKEEKKT